MNVDAIESQFQIGSSYVGNRTSLARRTSGSEWIHGRALGFTRAPMTQTGPTVIPSEQPALSQRFARILLRRNRGRHIQAESEASAKYGVNVLTIKDLVAEGEGFGLPQRSKSFEICEIVREIDSHDPHDPLKSRGLHT
jgi:hypothetical protein